MSETQALAMPINLTLLSSSSSWQDLTGRKEEPKRISTGDSLLK
ncbi:hypothetical protein [Adhaeribacter arboris]|nr:hypothetical protein [Adhaeribacter arboris]